MRRLRFALGRAYTRAWHAADALLQRGAPRSVRAGRARPRLPAAPVHRRYGVVVGRPVDRVYIERFLVAHAADVQGRTLEILDDVYTRRFGGAAATRRDILDLDPANARATVRGDLVSGEGIPAGAFDCFICTQTLSLTYDVHAAVATAHGLLKPGGVLLLTVPGISQQADPDVEAFPDHWRFTKRSVQRLLREAFGADAEIAVSAYGTVAASAAFLYGLPADEVDPALLDPHDPDYEMVVCARAVRQRVATSA